MLFFLVLKQFLRNRSASGSTKGDNHTDSGDKSIFYGSCCRSSLTGIVADNLASSGFVLNAELSRGGTHGERVIFKPLLGGSRLGFSGLFVLAEKNAAVCGIDFQRVTLSNGKSTTDFLGMTTRPRSSMRRTIPVAFIISNPF